MIIDTTDCYIIRENELGIYDTTECRVKFSTKQGKEIYVLTIEGKEYFLTLPKERLIKK